MRVSPIPQVRGHIYIHVATQNVNLTLRRGGWVFKVLCWHYNTVEKWQKERVWKKN